MPSDVADILTDRQRKQIELEVVSSEARRKLTRLLRARCRGGEADAVLARQNAIINIANTVMDRRIYVLEPDDWGNYEMQEYAWHTGEIEAIMRRPGTTQLIETLADLITEGWIRSGQVNSILENDRCGVRFHERGDKVEVEVAEIPAPDASAAPDKHPNIRQLFERMDRAMQDKDWSLVLHTGASIFETLAKLAVPLPTIQDQSLGSFFGAYRKHSKLAGSLLDAIEEIYKRRNIEPLSGHGSAKDPSITREEAIYVSHVTRTLVRLERELADI